MEKKNAINKKKSGVADAVIYQAKNGAIELRGDFSHETIWATQAQIATLFNAERSVITKHLKNVFKDGELDEKSVCANFAHTAEDGKTYQVQFYNLDVILSVGYRVNSKQATTFRRWATNVLRRHIVDGYTINRTRIAANYSQFLKAAEEIKHFLPDAAEVDAASAVELIRAFAATWLSLDAYDRSDLPVGGATRKQVAFTARELAEVFADFKQELATKKEAGDLFGAERSPNSIAGIVGNVFQSFGGKDVYATVEEKAAHLLYFVVKNHPFADGNKRSGAFAFIWFLKSAKLLDPARLTPDALTALTLLVAESKTDDKNRVIGLILLLLKR